MCNGRNTFLTIELCIFFRLRLADARDACTTGAGPLAPFTGRPISDPSITIRVRNVLVADSSLSIRVSDFGDYTEVLNQLSVLDSFG